MTDPLTKIDRTSLGSLDMARTLVGLWQVADMEKDGSVLDPETSADQLGAIDFAAFSH